MALYEYRCSKCQELFEISHPIKQKPLRKCPGCGRLGLVRQISLTVGRVARTADQMSTVGDLAKFNTDKLTQGEKQAKDNEYAEGSKLAKHNLAKQGAEKPWYHNGSDPKDLSQKLAKATPKQKAKYIEKGDIPS